MESITLAVARADFGPKTASSAGPSKIISSDDHLGIVRAGWLYHLGELAIQVTWHSDRFRGPRSMCAWKPSDKTKILKIYNMHA